MKSYRFSYTAIGQLTRLGWLARVPLCPGEIEVLHGDLVEIGEEWFVEGCWDGPVTAANFDRSSCFFGSGIRLRGNSVKIVASCATVDNLVYCEARAAVIVSNSLILLLSGIGAHLDRRHSYAGEFSSALKGIKQYAKSFPVVHHSLEKLSQLYFGSLAIEDGRVRTEHPNIQEDFPDFSEYISFLERKLRALHANAISVERQHPMTCYATLSTGYDSTAVAVLAKKCCGVETCITTDPTVSKPLPLEDATGLAKKIGMKPILIGSDATGLGDRELYYYAANFHHFETIFDKATRLFESASTPALLLTGYHGDKVWDKNLPASYVSDELRRGDMSGKGLSEIRLKAGFINAAIPFLGARKISQISAISNAPEMTPWSIGGEYDRPIPRRICEDAGLPRRAFGHHKRRITTHKGLPTDPTLRKCFERSLKDQFRIGPSRLVLFDLLDRLSYRADRLHLRGFGFLSDLKQLIIFRMPNLRMLLFIWAVNRLVIKVEQELRTNACSTVAATIKGWSNP